MDGVVSMSKKDEMAIEINAEDYPRTIDGMQQYIADTFQDGVVFYDFQVIEALALIEYLRYRESHGFTGDPFENKQDIVIVQQIDKENGCADDGKRSD